MNLMHFLRQGSLHPPVGRERLQLAAARHQDRPRQRRAHLHVHGMIFGTPVHSYCATPDFVPRDRTPRLTPAPRPASRTTSHATTQRESSPLAGRPAPPGKNTLRNKVLPNYMTNLMVRSFKVRGSPIGERVQPRPGRGADLHRGGRVTHLCLHRPRRRVGQLHEQHPHHYQPARRNHANRKVYTQ